MRKEINPSELPELLLDLMNQIEALKTRVTALEDRAYEEIENVPTE